MHSFYCRTCRPFWGPPEAWLEKLPVSNPPWPVVARAWNRLDAHCQHYRTEKRWQGLLTRSFLASLPRGPKLPTGYVDSIYEYCNVFNNYCIEYILQRVNLAFKAYPWLKYMLGFTNATPSIAAVRKCPVPPVNRCLGLAANCQGWMLPHQRVTHHYYLQALLWLLWWREWWGSHVKGSTTWVGGTIEVGRFIDIDTFSEWERWRVLLNVRESQGTKTFRTKLAM